MIWTKAIFALFLFSALASAQDQLVPAPPRGNQGEGPFERLIIRGATLIDGTGGMPRGPVDIVVEGNRIVDIRNVGVPNVAIDEEGRPQDASREIDASGAWVLPGFVNIHTHVGGIPKAPEAEYTYKLWMAHGITTIRGVAAGPMNWTLLERERSAKNEIVAPRIFAYHRPGSGEDWTGGRIDSAEKAREWVRFAAEKGIDGLKLDSHRPEIMGALLDEAKKHGLGSTAHLSQRGVAEMNALDAARLGLGTVTHFYGLFEALYDSSDVQAWPADANYNNEQDRFAQVAMQWDRIYPRGSDEWNALLDEFLELDLILDPTMTAYVAVRDVMRERRAEWHDTYTLPSLEEYYRPNRTNHASYWYYWTTWEEVAWRNFYRVWMQLLDDYKIVAGASPLAGTLPILTVCGASHRFRRWNCCKKRAFTRSRFFAAQRSMGPKRCSSPRASPFSSAWSAPGFSRTSLSWKKTRLQISRSSTAPEPNGSTTRRERPSVWAE